MTRKQLEGVIVLVSMYDDHRFTIEQINKKFGLELTEETSRGEVITAYLSKHNIKLEE